MLVSQVKNSFHFFYIVATSSSLIIDLLRVKLVPIHAISHRLIGVRWSAVEWIRKYKWKREVTHHTLTRKPKQNELQRFIWKDLSDQEVAQSTALNVFLDSWPSLSLPFGNLFDFAAARQYVVDLNCYFLAFGLKQYWWDEMSEWKKVNTMALYLVASHSLCAYSCKQRVFHVCIDMAALSCRKSAYKQCVLRYFVRRATE